MKRLREIEPSTPLLEKAQALIETAPPVDDSRERMLRVRRALDRRHEGGGMLRRLPALALAALVALFGASAFAAVRIYEAVKQADERAAAAAKARAHDAQAAKRFVPAEPKAPAVPEAAVTAPASSPDQPERATPHTQTRPQHASRLAAENSELVHRAVRALRRDRNPALAVRLLEQHRARSPEGPLAEEALSLLIEAESALRAPRARALAREYLTRYPGGRYTAVAQRALADAPP